MNNGVIYWFKLVGDLYYSCLGEFEGYVGYCLDIQDIKVVVEKLVLWECELLNLFELSFVVFVIIIRDNFIFMMVNSFYVQFVGRMVQEIVNYLLLEVLFEIVGQGFDDFFRNVLEIGKFYVVNEVNVQLM